MAKIIIPESSFWKVFRNRLQLTEAVVNQGKKDEPITAFNKPENTYVMNIPNTVNWVKEMQGAVLWKLGIAGKLEINLGCPIDFRIRQEGKKEELVGELASSWYSSCDCFKGDEITINNTSTEGNRSSIRFYYNGEDWKDEKVKKITLNAQHVNCELGVCRQLEELNILAEEINDFKLNKQKNLKRINMPNIKNIAIKWNNVDLFNNKLRDDCTITINKNCTVEFDGRVISEAPDVSDDFEVKDLKITNIVNSRTAKTFVENEKTFTVNINELELLLKKRLSEEFKKIVLKADNKIDQKIKAYQDNITKNGNKEKTRG